MRRHHELGESFHFDDVIDTSELGDNKCVTAVQFLSDSKDGYVMLLCSQAVIMLGLLGYTATREKNYMASKSWVVGPGEVPAHTRDQVCCHLP